MPNNYIKNNHQVIYLATQPTHRHHTCYRCPSQTHQLNGRDEEEEIREGGEHCTKVCVQWRTLQHNTNRMEDGWMEDRSGYVASTSHECQWPASCFIICITRSWGNIWHSNLPTPTHWQMRCALHSCKCAGTSSLVLLSPRQLLPNHSFRNRK